MRRLNNRGYLIVELILASVLAMTVAYFLLNLVVKMSSKNQDLYVETALLTDKAIMTNLVMEDVNKYTLVGVSNIDTDKGVTLEFMKKDENGNYRLDETVAKQIYDEEIREYLDAHKDLSQEEGIKQFCIDSVYEAYFPDTDITKTKYSASV